MDFACAVVEHFWVALGVAGLRKVVILEDLVVVDRPLEVEAQRLLVVAVVAT